MSMSFINVFIDFKKTNNKLSKKSNYKGKNLKIIIFHVSVYNSIYLSIYIKLL